MNAVHINVGKMTDTQLLDELRSDPSIVNCFRSLLPEVNQIDHVVDDDV